MTLKHKLGIVGAVSLAITAHAGPELDTIGVTLLRATDPTLVGTGIHVAQVEAPENPNGLPWQVNPFVVGKPANLFTYISSSGSASNYPNALGTQSDHANSVAGHFYGNSSGVAPGVFHVDNYEANHFYQSVIVGNKTILPKIVNQTFVFDSSPSQETVDSRYDNYAVENETLFISGVGNSGSPRAPSTAYNGIGVAAFGGSSGIGPTADNGRSKPDITAPGSVTSFSTPLVAGAAAILRQAGLRGDGGAGTTTSSVDIRTIKALLLNGAMKPTNWTHTVTAPLDTRFGSGILNVFNSYKQLSAGKHSFVESTSHAPGGSHLPDPSPTVFRPLSGWDFASITNQFVLTAIWERVNHYYFSVSSNDSTFSATLVWNRPVGQTSPRNLDLFLYDATSGNEVARSVSTIDNVEHIFAKGLPAGHYDLQVVKRVPTGISLSETYALAYNFFAVRLEIERVGNQIALSWPIAPAGFRLQSTANLNVPIAWANVTNAPVITNNQNRVLLDAASSTQFFRLIQP